MGDESLHRALIGLGPFEELQVLAQVATISVDRVGREPAFDVESEKVLVDALGQGRGGRAQTAASASRAGT
jgi:hypothetical protein